MVAYSRLDDLAFDAVSNSRRTGTFSDRVALLAGAYDAGSLAYQAGEELANAAKRHVRSSEKLDTYRFILEKYARSSDAGVAELFNSFGNLLESSNTRARTNIESYLADVANVAQRFKTVSATDVGDYAPIAVVGAPKQTSKLTRVVAGVAAGAALFAAACTSYNGSRSDTYAPVSPGPLTTLGAGDALGQSIFANDQMLANGIPVEVVQIINGETNPTFAVERGGMDTYKGKEPTVPFETFINELTIPAREIGANAITPEEPVFVDASGGVFNNAADYLASVNGKPLVLKVEAVVTSPEVPYTQAVDMNGRVTFVPTPAALGLESLVTDAAPSFGAAPERNVPSYTSKAWSGFKEFATKFGETAKSVVAKAASMYSRNAARNTEVAQIPVSQPQMTASVVAMSYMAPASSVSSSVPKSSVATNPVVPELTPSMAVISDRPELPGKVQGTVKPGKRRRSSWMHGG